jgi:sporulation protein YlmC with PRC-barrel domain
MSKLTISMAAAAAISFAALAASAQQAPPAPKVTIPAKTFYKGQEAGQYLARDRLIGAKVLNKDGQVIGDIEDLIVTSDNRIEGVIMGVGGFLGAGEKKVGVLLAALKFETKDGKTVVSLPQATKEVLAALEPYKRATPGKSALERAKEKAKELADKTKETVKDATEKASETAKSAYDKATGKQQAPEEKKQ